MCEPGGPGLIPRKAVSREAQPVATAFEKSDWETLIKTNKSPKQARLLKELSSYNNDPVEHGLNEKPSIGTRTTGPAAPKTIKKKSKSPAKKAKPAKKTAFKNAKHGKTVKVTKTSPSTTGRGKKQQTTAAADRPKRQKKT